MVLAVGLVSPERAAFLLEWSERHLTRAAARLEAALEEAERASRMPATELMARISESDQLLAMLTTLVETAVRTSLESKVRLMGRALGSGAIAQDDAEVDEAQLLLRVLADLEPAELRILEFVHSLRDYVPTERAADGNGWMGPGGIVLWGEQSAPGLKRETISHQTGMSSEAVAGSLAVLRRTGLVETSGLSFLEPNAAHRISALGVKIRRLLAEAGPVE